MGEVSTLKEDLVQAISGFQAFPDGMDSYSPNGDSSSQVTSTPQNGSTAPRRMHGVLSTPVPDSAANAHTPSAAPVPDKSDALPPTTGSRATSLPISGARSPSAHSTPNGRTAAAGGLKLSQDQLEMVMGAARTRPNASGGLSLEGLTQAVRTRLNGATVQSSNGANETVSLARLAELMKNRRPAVPRARPKTALGPKNNGAAGKISLGELERMIRQANSAAGGKPVQGTNGGDNTVRVPLSELAKELKRARDGGRVDPALASRRPASSSKPSAAAGRQPRAATVAPPPPNDSLQSKRLEHRAATSKREAEPKGEEDSFQEMSRQDGVEDRLDINLVANLVRWVGNSKRRLGTVHMQELLEVYRLTGHLAPAVYRLILRLAALAVMRDESESPKHSVEDLVQAFQTLHGIVYGSGTVPVAWEVSSAIRWSGPDLQGQKEVQRPTEDFAEEVISHASAPEVVTEEPTAKPTLDTQEPDSALEHKTEGVSSGALPHNETPEGPEETSGQARPSREFREAYSTFRAAVMSLTTPDEGGDTGQAGAADTPRAQPTVRVDQVGLSSVGESRRSTNGHLSPAETPDDARDFGRGPTLVRYPSDLTDRQWHKVEVLTPAAKKGGRPAKHERREILNGIRYQLHSGCSWRSLPEDLPPWKVVHHYYRTWRQTGVWDPIAEALGGEESPSISSYATPATWGADEVGPNIDQKNGATTLDGATRRTEVPAATR